MSALACAHVLELRRAALGIASTDDEPSPLAALAERHAVPVCVLGAGSALGVATVRALKQHRADLRVTACVRPVPPHAAAEAREWAWQLRALGAEVITCNRTALMSPTTTSSSRAAESGDEWVERVFAANRRGVLDAELSSGSAALVTERDVHLLRRALAAARVLVAVTESSDDADLLSLVRPAELTHAERIVALVAAPASACAAARVSSLKRPVCSNVCRLWPFTTRPRCCSCCDTRVLVFARSCTSRCR